MSETTMSEYIKGFNDGYAFILNEIETQIKQTNSHDAMVLVQLLQHLKMEKKHESL